MGAAWRVRAARVFRSCNDGSAHAACGERLLARGGEIEVNEFGVLDGLDDSVVIHTRLDHRNHLVVGERMSGGCLCIRGRSGRWLSDSLVTIALVDLAVMRDCIFNAFLRLEEVVFFRPGVDGFAVVDGSLIEILHGRLRIFRLVGECFIGHPGVVEAVSIFRRLGRRRGGFECLQRALPQARSRKLVAFVEGTLLLGEIDFNGLAGVHHLLGNLVHGIEQQMILQFSIGGRVEIFASGSARYALPCAGHGSLDAFGNRVTRCIEFTIVLGDHIFRGNAAASSATSLEGNGERTRDAQETLLLGRILAHGHRRPCGYGGFGMRKINDAAGDDVGWGTFIHTQGRFALGNFRFKHGLQVA